MDLQHGIRGASGTLQQHSNVTQSQARTPLVQRLLRAIVAPDNMKTVPFVKTDARA